jgi:hypothetical protein
MNNQCTSLVKGQLHPNVNADIIGDVNAQNADDPFMMKKNIRPLQNIGNILTCLNINQSVR